MHLLHQIGAVQPPQGGSILQKHPLAFRLFFQEFSWKNKQTKLISNKKHGVLKLQHCCPTLLFNLSYLAYCLFKDGAFVWFDVEVIDVAEVSWDQLSELLDVFTLLLSPTLITPG